MAPIDDQINRLNELNTKWKIFCSKTPEPERYCEISGDLYQVRNAGWNGNKPLGAWPADLVDSDDAMMAAVEHYFLCRCWVGTAKFPAWEVRAMDVIYDLEKIGGVTPRHNPNKPTSRPTAL